MTRTIINLNAIPASKRGQRLNQSSYNVDGMAQDGAG